MPQSDHAPANGNQPERWTLLAVDGQEAGAALAAAPIAMPGFFAGWILAGVLVGLWLTRRGHDRRLMVSLGAGLGPLMVIVASDMVRRRDLIAQPIVVDRGVNRGGGLDILVLICGRPDDVQSVAPTLQSVRNDIGTLVLAQTVPYESMNDPHDDTITTASASLIAAREFLPYGGAQLELHPGTPAIVARRFAARHDRTIVLFGVRDTAVDADAQSHSSSVPGSLGQQPHHPNRRT